MVQLYLRIDRLDLAQKEQKAMKALDEDNSLSMLATAWVNLSMVSYVLNYFDISCKTPCSYLYCQRIVTMTRRCTH